MTCEKIAFRSFLAVGIFCLAGCVIAPPAPSAPPPSAEAVAAADTGELPDAYGMLIRDFIGATLRDPYSAVYEFKEVPVKRGWYDEKTGTYEFAWIASVDVNAKNAYGAYTGVEDYSCRIVHGAVQSCSNLTKLRREIDAFVNGSY